MVVIIALKTEEKCYVFIHKCDQKQLTYYTDCDN